MRGKAIQKTLIKTNQSNSTKPLPGRISICSVVLFFNASSCSVHLIIFTVKGGIYFLFWTYLAQEAALQQKKGLWSSDSCLTNWLTASFCLIYNMHVPALLSLLFVPNPGCFRDVKNKSGTRYNNAGFTSNKQTNKGNLLERRPTSIHAIRTLPLATLWTKINPPFLVRKIHPNLSLWSGSTWRQHFCQPAANLCKHLSRALTCLHHGPF